MLFTEDEALLQLHGDHSNLLDTITELRTLGVNGLAEPPQLVVCGGKNSGKSSVLDAISQIPFPSTEDRYTRFATEVTLLRSKSHGIDVSIEPGPSCVDRSERDRLRSCMNADFSNGFTFPSVINVAEHRMGLTNDEDTGVSDNVLKVEISGPDQPELTFVDLPGLDFPGEQQEGGRSRMVRELAEKYMANPRSIILVVVSAGSDDNVQDLVDMARRFNSNGERTLGILTHPDALQVRFEEDSFLQIFTDERIHLQRGWHILRNENSEVCTMSDGTWDEQEKDFFSQGRWAALPRECVGVGSLRQRLCNIILEYRQHRLPCLVADIQKRISDRQDTLSHLGAPRSSIQLQRAYLLNIASRFERIAGQAVDGIYIDGIFSELGHMFLRRRIWQLNDFFAKAMAIRGARRAVAESPVSPPFVINPHMQSWSPQSISRNALELEAKELARRNYGLEATGNVNHLVAGILFRDQAQPWEELARAHLFKAWETVRHFVLLVLRHLTDHRTSMALARSVIEPTLEYMKERLLEKLKELILHTKRALPLPIGKALSARIEEARRKRLLQSLRSELTSENSEQNDFDMKAIEEAFLHLDASRDDFAAAEIVDHMQAYYDIAVSTFVDNINNLAIETCLMDPIRGIFTSQVVNSLDHGQIEELATEPPHIRDERCRLCTELEKLQAAMRILNVFRPLELPLEDVSMHTLPPLSDCIEIPGSQEVPTSSQASAPNPPVMNDTQSEPPAPKRKRSLRSRRKTSAKKNTVKRNTIRQPSIFDLQPSLPTTGSGLFSSLWQMNTAQNSIDSASSTFRDQTNSPRPSIPKSPFSVQSPPGRNVDSQLRACLSEIGCSTTGSTPSTTGQALFGRNSPCLDGRGKDLRSESEPSVDLSTAKPPIGSQAAQASRSLSKSIWSTRP